MTIDIFLLTVLVSLGAGLIGGYIGVLIARYDADQVLERVALAVVVVAALCFLLGEGSRGVLRSSRSEVEDLCRRE
jgi:uncharacterized membrane protein YfcA